MKGLFVNTNDPFFLFIDLPELVVEGYFLRASLLFYW